jgi:CheY-like chemotaxis protein
MDLLLEIAQETAAFYASLARRPGDPPELSALWRCLADEEGQHAEWMRRVRAAPLAGRALASLAGLPIPPLETALEDIRRQRRRIEGGEPSSADAIAAALAIEASEPSRAWMEVVAAVHHERELAASAPARTAHLGQLALAARWLGRPELAATIRDLATRIGAAAGRGSTVLIVDDDPDMVETCVRILRPTGHVCLTATGGPEALDLLRRQRPDLILADLRMPEMDGLTLLSHARRVAPEVPFVLVTAYGSVETARRARETGAAAYLAKPFGVGDLRDVVARALWPGGQQELM